MRTITIVGEIVGTALSLAVLGGCAANGQGDPCTPEAIPANGFLKEEVYVETSAVQCRTRVCMVYHLKGNPECTELLDHDCDASRSTDPANACFSGGHTLCIQSDSPEMVQQDDNSPDRVFCTCRCSATGNSSLPLCQCTDGFRCVPDSDPGGGYCVPNELALAAGICANDGECERQSMLGTGVTGTTCDATHHCH